MSVILQSSSTCSNHILMRCLHHSRKSYQYYFALLIHHPLKEHLLLKQHERDWFSIGGVEQLAHTNSCRILQVPTLSAGTNMRRHSGNADTNSERQGQGRIARRRTRTLNSL